MKLSLFILSFVLFSTAKLKADTDSIYNEKINTDSLCVVSAFINHNIPYSISGDTVSNQKILRKERLVSAIAAFPFPLGFMGAHRVILGTKPWIPVVYVATFGGVFGILPLIDFCVIVFSKDLEKYKNNPHVFMWIK